MLIFLLEVITAFWYKNKIEFRAFSFFQTNRILEAQTNVKDLPLIEAKLGYIRAWQNLPWFGVHLFVVRFTNQKKDELLGVTNNRIMRMDLNTGDHIKTWRFSTMKVSLLNKLCKGYIRIFIFHQLIK